MKHENRIVFHIRADNGDDNDSIVSDKEKAALFFFSDANHLKIYYFLPSNRTFAAIIKQQHFFCLSNQNFNYCT